MSTMKTLDNATLPAPVGSQGANLRWQEARGRKHGDDGSIGSARRAEEQEMPKYKTESKASYLEKPYEMVLQETDREKHVVGRPGQKRGRGREPGFRMSDEHRVKIQNSNILNALVEHACGKRNMSATQVSAGLGLLKKVLPDLQAVTIGGDPANPLRHEHAINLSSMSDEDLAELIHGGAQSIAL
jgi:hypothetical protein